MDRILRHGIAVREKKTNKLVKFLDLPTGKVVLRTLFGMRINMSDDYVANEEVVTDDEIQKIK